MPSKRRMPGLSGSRVLISRRRIAARVDRIADQITDHYGRRPILLLAVLTGAVIFAADLVRRLTMPVELAAATARSYRGQTTRGGRLQTTLPSELDVTGREVLVVDDILDSGQTLTALRRLIHRRGAVDVRTCALVRKERPDLPERAEADFVGFDIPDLFVVGYGLDFDGHFRHLPDIRVLAEHDRARIETGGGR